MPQPFTLIDDGKVTEVAASVEGERVALSPSALADSLGWKLEPQGLCREDVCVPVGRHRDRVNQGGVDLAAFAELLERPLALDASEGVAALAASAASRGSQLASLEAPDFTLPDLDGKLHALSDQRGKKVLLAAWASW